MTAMARVTDFFNPRQKARLVLCFAMSLAWLASEIYVGAQNVENTTSIASAEFRVAICGKAKNFSLSAT